MEKLLKWLEKNVGLISMILGAVAICAGHALFLSKKETINELISPISNPILTRQLIPTPTIPQEPEPTYLQGSASYYDRTYCEKYNPDCITASGEVFDDTALTCACGNEYALGTMLEITYQGESVVVRCNDRGNFKKYGRIADLSKEAFSRLAPPSKGTIYVKVKPKI